MISCLREESLTVRLKMSMAGNQTDSGADKSCGDAGISWHYGPSNDASSSLSYHLSMQRENIKNSTVSVILPTASFSVGETTHIVLSTSFRSCSKTRPIRLHLGICFHIKLYSDSPNRLLPIDTYRRHPTMSGLEKALFNLKVILPPPRSLYLL